MTPQPADAATILRPGFRLDLLRTLAPLAHGRGDPSVRLSPDGAWLAARTPNGPATMQLLPGGATLECRAWGPGAGWMIERAGEIAGLADDPAPLVAHHPLIAELARRFVGVRLPRTGLPFQALLPAICEQKITGDEARRAYRAIVRAYGEPAPGPAGLWVAPRASVLAGLRYFAFHPLGLERRRAEVLMRAAGLASRLQAATPEEGMRLMTAVPGIGPWTIGEVVRVAYGDPDAVSIGDYHLPNLVAWALAGEPRADDGRMLELLEPYRGQRARVQRLLELSGLRPPRYGPRMSSRSIAAI
jgi:3-methyladenine DNA glycosylase/8-oxoguanine DNA glycosylase